MPRPPSIRTLARLTGFSSATVANALNGSPRVAAATAKRIRTAADKAGYQRNPLVGTLMAAMRRSQGSTFRGVLAVADIAEPDRPAHGPFHRELMAGCTAAAGALGFKIEFFEVGPDHLSPERLSGVLKARGIHGLIVLPSWRIPDFARFDWSAFSGVYADYIPDTPTLNSVCCDHYRSMLELLERLHARGYRRPGLVLETGRDERVHRRMSAAVRVFQADQKGARAIAPLFAPAIAPELVTAWLEREKPDVVLSHHAEMLDWIQQSGRSVPASVGFVGLNLAKTKRACAGLDLQPREIGRCAVEILIGQVQRQAWGVPATPTNTTILARFIDGPTLRPAPRPRP